MKKQLLKLFNEAGFHRPEIERLSVEHKFEKFAELIVAECMSMCEETQAGYFKHRKAADDFQDKNIYAEGEAACDVIKYKMKKHFGVE
jgi:tRNA(Ile)-lysidine synthase TilS/MesJ